MKTLRIAGLVLLVACTTNTDTQQQRLIALNGMVPWTANTNHTVPICFVTPLQITTTPPLMTGQLQLATRGWFRRAFERAWPAVSWVDVGGFNDCPSTGTTRFVRFALTTGGGGQTNVGMNGVQFIPNANFPLPTTPFDANPYLDLTHWNPGYNVNAVGNANQTPGQNDFALLVAHETGHLMGWQHEQDSPNNVNVNWCHEPVSSWGYTALTALDTQSIMSWSYCTNDHLGLSDLDIQGARQVYGVRPESADSDADGWSDLVDNCPYVYNKDQSDMNWDAELTVAVRDNQRTGVNNDEGHIPNPGDPQWYKDYWHSWYAGDACDLVGVTGARTQSYKSTLVTQTGCWDLYVGGVTTKNWNNLATCPVLLQDAQLDEDSVISSPTGFRDPVSGTAKPAACWCSTATSDKSNCSKAQTYNCQFASDGSFPVSNDALPWFRLTTEWSGSAWLTQNISTTFAPPIAGSTPNTQTLFWNPFYAAGGWTSDVQRMGLRSTTQLSAVLWTGHVVLSSASQPPNLPNNYVGVDAKQLPGTNVHWIPYFAPKWKPVAWWGKNKKVFGEIRFGAVTQDGSGHGVVIEQKSGVLLDASYRMSQGASAALVPVAAGSQEMLVADDDVANGSRTSLAPSVLLVDAGTTRIRGALTPSTGTVAFTAASDLPAQSTTSLRAYGNEAGKLFSLEGAQLASRDVAAALAGIVSTTSLTITGVVPASPLAVVWSAGQQRLIVLDLINSGPRKWNLRLLSMTTGGVSTQLWSTQQFSGSVLPSGFLSLGGYGEVLVSLNVTGGYHEIVSVRADDGQPLQSYRGIGTLHAAAVSDGAGFTIPIAVTASETQPNMLTTYVPRSGTTVSACAATWFESVVGNQSTMVLGNPTVDCQ